MKLHTRHFGTYKVARLGRIIRIGPLVVAVTRHGIRRKPHQHTT